MSSLVSFHDTMSIRLYDARTKNVDGQFFILHHMLDLVCSECYKIGLAFKGEWISSRVTLSAIVASVKVTSLNSTHRKLMSITAKYYNETKWSNQITQMIFQSLAFEYPVDILPLISFWFYDNYFGSFTKDFFEHNETKLFAMPWSRNDMDETKLEIIDQSRMTLTKGHQVFERARDSKYRIAWFIRQARWLSAILLLQLHLGGRSPCNSPLWRKKEKMEGCSVAHLQNYKNNHFHLGRGFWVMSYKSWGWLSHFWICHARHACRYVLIENHQNIFLILQGGLIIQLKALLGGNRC